MIKDNDNSIDKTARQIDKMASDVQTLLVNTAFDALDKTAW